MDCGVPFCQSATGCPIDNLIPEWNDLVYNNRWKEAIERLHKTNNFPEFTGRTCPAPCEGACVLGHHRSAGHDQEHRKRDRRSCLGGRLDQPATARVTNRQKSRDRRQRTGRIGRGRSTEQGGHDVTVYERADRIGGLLQYGIPNMKLSKEVVQRRIDKMTAEGVKFVTGVDVGKDIDPKQLQSDFHCSVVGLRCDQAARSADSESRCEGCSLCDGVSDGEHAADRAR